MDEQELRLEVLKLANAYCSSIAAEHGVGTEAHDVAWRANTYRTFVLGEDWRERVPTRTVINHYIKQAKQAEAAAVAAALEKAAAFESAAA